MHARATPIYRYTKIMYLPPCLTSATKRRKKPHWIIYKRQSTVCWTWLTAASTLQVYIIRKKIRWFEATTQDYYLIIFTRVYVSAPKTRRYFISHRSILPSSASPDWLPKETPSPRFYLYDLIQVSARGSAQWAKLTELGGCDLRMREGEFRYNTLCCDIYILAHKYRVSARNFGFELRVEIRKFTKR